MPYTPVPSYKDNPALKSNARFKAAAKKATELKEEIEDKQASYDTTRMQKILPELLAAGVDRVDFDGYQIGVVTVRDSKRLSKDKLIVELEKRGIDISILDKCSEKVDGYTTVQIRSPREERLQVAKKVRRMLTD